MHFCPLQDMLVKICVGEGGRSKSQVEMCVGATHVLCPSRSLTTNTVVQTYNAGRPIWSCCWCLDDTNYVYAGLVNGSVLVYDLRDTSSHVQELAPQKSR